jgi:hypothetical protein
LTVQQPWAWAIVHGGKDVENRTRNLAGSYRGPVAIHAGLKTDRLGIGATVIRDAWREQYGWDIADAPPLRSGAVIGVVDLVDVHTATTCMDVIDGEWATCSPWAEPQYVEHGGRERRDVVHLVLEDPRPLTHPIPAKGRLGLWTPDAELLAAIREQVPA